MIIYQATAQGRNPQPQYLPFESKRQRIYQDFVITYHSVKSKINNDSSSTCLSWLKYIGLATTETSWMHFFPGEYAYIYKQNIHFDINLNFTA